MRAGDPDASEEWISEFVAQPSDFNLELGGVRFSLYNFAPFAFRSLYEEGYFVPCAELGDLRRRPGPLDQLCSLR